ncbi:MAG: SH3 domain-containing protein, partial [Leptospirales bacterium]|nr:SH3 domain-containing protein [Leptospirales bacterium]
MKKIGACISSLLLFFTALVIVQNLSSQLGQAKVTATVLNVRHIPSAAGNVIAKLKRGEIINIVERSKYTSEVVGTSDYWYKIELPKKQTGWVFGQFISFELNLESGLRWRSVTPDSSQRFTSIIIAESGQMMVGTQSGNMFLSSDNGKTFRKILPQALGVSIGKINNIYNAKGAIWVAASGASNGGIWKS